jgi:hypothetical protein
MLVLPDSARPEVSKILAASANMREYLKQVFQLFFANHHKIPQNFNILTFDLKTAQKVQNLNNCIIRRLFSLNLDS